MSAPTDTLRRALSFEADSGLRFYGGKRVEIRGMRCVLRRRVQRILEGLRRYEETHRPLHGGTFARLAAGQSPRALFLTCADSRIVPSLILGADPGELFVVRNVANLVPPHDHREASSVASAVWYATNVLEVDDVIVCGHSNCGGMKALLDAAPLPDAHLARWLETAKGARAAWDSGRVLDSSLSAVDQLSQTCTLQQVQNLHTHPAVAKRLETGTLRLHAWWFDVRDGSVTVYSNEADRYVAGLPELERVVQDIAPRRVA